MLFAGIDPGITGGIALFDPASRWLEVHDMPTKIVRVSGKKRKRVDPDALHSILTDLGEDRIEHLALEKVWGMQRDTPTTAFGLGEAYGVASAAVVIAAIPHTLVAPVTWQKAAGVTCGGKKGKSMARDIVLRLLPEYQARLAPVTKTGRVDATLLALYAAGKLTNH